MPRRVYKKRAPKRKQVKGKGNRRGRARSSKQMANIVETIEFNRLAPNSVQACTFSLSQFQRAKVLATNFRWYKPTSVTWKIEPQFGTYQAVANGPTVPYLYTLMNRTQDGSFMTLSDMLTQGAKPVRLVGSKSLTYRPNWCSPALIAQNVQQGSGFGGYLNQIALAGMTSAYGWLQAPDVTGGSIAPIMNLQGGTQINSPVTNNPATTIFNGHQYYVDQQTVAGTTPTFKITCTVKWSFKDPKNTLAAPTDNIFADISGAEQY